MPLIPVVIHSGSDRVTTRGLSLHTVWRRRLFTFCISPLLMPGSAGAILLFHSSAIENGAIYQSSPESAQDGQTREYSFDVWLALKHVREHKTSGERNAIPRRTRDHSCLPSTFIDGGLSSSIVGQSRVDNPLRILMGQQVGNNSSYTLRCAKIETINTELASMGSNSTATNIADDSYVGTLRRFNYWLLVVKKRRRE